MAYIGKTPTPAPLTSSDIAADIINSTHIGDTAISGFDALATAPADTDEFLISDAGVLKRLDASLVGGGGLVKLFTGSASSASTYAIDNTYINSTYDNYLVIVNASPATDAQVLKLRFNNSNSLNSSSHYAYGVHVDSSSTYRYSHSATSAIDLAYQTVGNATGESITSAFRLMNVNSTSIATQVHGQSNLNTGSGDLQFSTFWGGYILAQRSLVTDGFTLNFASGNIIINAIAVYGFEK